MKRILLVFIAIAASLPAAAQSSGVVRADLGFFQRNSGFCDTTETGRDCTGAVYTDVEVDSRQPLREMRAYLRRSTDNVLLGQAVTNTSGIASISWTSSGAAPQAHIDIQYENGNGRFSIRGTSGGTVTSFTSNFQLTNGTTTTSPQSRTATWGASGAPSNWANLYAAFQLGWESLDDSANMKSTFTGVQVRAFNTGGFNDTDSDQKIIRISDQRQFVLFTAPHEMGHQAEWFSKNLRVLFDYCLNDPGCTHASNSQEHQAAAFAEGLAEFQAARAVYRQSSPQPVTCRAAEGLPCTLLALSTLEPSTTTASCTTAHGRQERSTARYLWDVYDNVVDTSYSDTLSMSYFHLFDGLKDWPSGTNNREIEEPFDWFGNVDNADGRNAADFAFVWATNYSSAFSSSTQLNNNCGAVLNP